MPVSEKNQLVFIHIPRSAGTFIERKSKLFQISTTWPKADLNSLFGFHKTSNVTLTLQHLTIQEMLKFKLIDPIKFKNFFKFSIVRNPYKRCLSLYYYWGSEKIFGDFSKFLKYLEDLNMNQYQHQGWILESDEDSTRVLNLGKYHPTFIKAAQYHFLPQWQYLCNDQGNLMVDQTYHYEDLFNTKSCQLHNNLVLPRLGITKIKNKKEYPDLYQEQPKLKERVYQIYQKDFDLFGYDK